MGDKWSLDRVSATDTPMTHTSGQVLRAWMPFAILSIFVLFWGLPTIKIAMNKATTPAFSRGGWDVPYLHKAVFRAQPVVAKAGAENAKFDFNLLTSPGSGCFLSPLLARTIF